MGGTVLQSATRSPSRLREGLGVGLYTTSMLAHPRPLPQAGGES
jgi:hypothetical protein